MGPAELRNYREKLRKEFGHLSFAELEIRVENNDGIDGKQARHWMNFLMEELQEEETQRAREVVQIARKAAEASAQSARYAMWAAIVAVLSVIATVAKEFVYPALR